MGPIESAERPVIYHSPDEVPAEGAHRTYVCAYSARHGSWRCTSCQRLQDRRVYRFWRHFPEVCGRDDESECYAGPFCPHCAELPRIAAGAY